MSEFKAGDTVWAASLNYGRGEIGSAVIEKVTAKQYRLPHRGVGAAFGYAIVVPRDKANFFATREEAVAHLVELFDTAVSRARSRLADLESDRARWAEELA